MINEDVLFERLKDHFNIADIYELRSKCRKIEYIYARLIYCEYQRKKGAHPRNIGIWLNRDRVTILQNLQKFQVEYEVNKQFRDLVDNIFEE